MDEYKISIWISTRYIIRHVRIDLPESLSESAADALTTASRCTDAPFDLQAPFKARKKVDLTRLHVTISHAQWGPLTACSSWLLTVSSRQLHNTVA